MRAIELQTMLNAMMESGEITNDTEVVVELTTGTYLWKASKMRVLTMKYNEEQEAKLLADNGMLKPQMLIITTSGSVRV